MDPISTEGFKIQRELVSDTSFKELSGKLTGDTDKGAPSFDEMIGGLIKDVDKAQKSADTSIQQLAAGEATTIQDVVMKLEEADLAFKLMKEVRNKLLEAYKETISMSQ
jgi:flagellar hook-basal body complex protein FliE